MWSSSIFQPLRKGVVKSCNQSDSAHCMNQSSLPKQCYGFGMFIPDPGSKYSTKRGGKIFFVLPFFVAANIIKVKIILFLNRQRKFFLPNRNYSSFYPKFVIKLSKYGFWIWDPRSELWKIPIPDPSSRGVQKGTSSRIRIRNTVDKFIL